MALLELYKIKLIRNHIRGEVTMSDFNVNEFLSSLDDDASQEDSPVMNPPKEFTTDLYKKWFRSKTQSGFLSIKPWFAGMKFKIDIGKTNPDGKLISSTSVYLDAFDFGAYLRSIVNGTADKNFPANERNGIPSPEGFASYGGAEINGKPVSRIFKAHYWQNGDSFDESAFAWKCGHFAARKSDTGAFIPDLKSPISVDFLKVTRQDICSISYLIDLSLMAYVSNNSEWYDQQ